MARRKRKKDNPIRDYGLAIVSAVLLAFAIRFFLVEAYRMPSRAMVPTVEAGDTLFVSKLAYGLRIPFSRQRVGGGASPAIGDVVIVEFADEPAREYIKRIVAGPGDRVRLRSGHLVVNGTDRSHPSSDGQPCGTEIASVEMSYAVCWEEPKLDNVAETLLGEGEYFVIGDLRAKSADTRRLKISGKVRLSDIRGKATTIWLSVNSAKDQMANDGWFSRIRLDRLFKKIE